MVEAALDTCTLHTIDTSTTSLWQGPLGPWHLTRHLTTEYTRQVLWGETACVALFGLAGNPHSSQRTHTSTHTNVRFGCKSCTSCYVIASTDVPLPFSLAHSSVYWGLGLDPILVLSSLVLVSRQKWAALAL